MKILTVLAFCFFTLLYCISIPAQADSNQSIQKQIEELKMQIEKLEQQMNSKTDDAATGSPEAWHSEIKVKTKKGTGLTFQTTDNNYKLRMSFFGQFMANYTDPDTDMDDNEGLGFSTKSLWVIWDGNAFAPWMKYTVQYDLSGGGALKDMRLSFAKNKAFIPTIGQYKVPFNREFLNSVTAMQFVGTSIITDYFQYGRDIGTGVYGFLGDGMIRYDAGIFQGEGPNTKNDKGDKSLLWAGRVQASFAGGDAKKVIENFAEEPTLMVGAAIAGTGGSDTNIGIPSGERKMPHTGTTTSFTADINYSNPRFSLTGEYIGRWADVDETGVGDLYDYGFRVQGGFFVIPKKIEIASRYAMVVFDDEAPAVLKEVGEIKDVEADKIWTFTQGLNYYLAGNHRWKMQLDYTFRRTKSLSGEETDDNMVRAQVQTYF